MAPENVTAGEFERWMRHLDSRLDTIEKTQSHTSDRVTRLENDSKVVKRIAAFISAAVGVVVSAIVWIVSLFKN